MQAAESAWLHAKRVHQEGGPSGLKEGVKVGESAFMPGHGEVTVVERYAYEQSRDRPQYVVEKKDGNTMAVSADELRPLESDSTAPPPKEEAKPEPKAKPAESRKVGIRRKRALQTDREPFLAAAEDLAKPGRILAGAGKRLAIGRIRKQIKKAGGDHPETEAILAKLEGGN